VICASCGCITVCVVCAHVCMCVCVSGVCGALCVMCELCMCVHVEEGQYSALKCIQSRHEHVGGVLIKLHPQCELTSHDCARMANIYH